ncbi:MAG: DUF4476 domain-containing protein [Bacteroidetes bacterium]|nr:DUF4476 domain-containing protein [Bacteroidota bacterium]
MKRIFTLIAFFLVTTFAYASPYQGILTVSTEGSNKVNIFIDSRNCGNGYTNDVVQTNINAGFHNVKVYKKTYGWNQRKAQLIYDENVYVKPGFQVNVLINRFGKACIEERRLGRDRDNDHHNEHNSWEHGYNHQAMNSADFNQLKQSICNSNFESTKMAVARQAMSSNCFTAAQVKELMFLFSFDNSRLDIAKTAYRSATDKNNYYVVNDALSFSSSKEALADFISTSR